MTFVQKYKKKMVDSKTVRLHRNLIEAVAIALSEIFENNRQADRVIERVLKSDKRWGSRDRGFVAETTYGMVRYWRLLNFVCEGEQPRYTDMIGAWLVIQNIEIPDWEEFDGVNPSEVRKKYTEAQRMRAVRESMPDWLDQRGQAELGDAWEAELHALNEPASVFLRVNTLKSDRDEVRRLLFKEDIRTEFVENLPDALRLIEKKNVFLSELFKRGFYEVQDAASQMVAPLLDIQPGMRVIDACAGAGGKTLHLAALMQNKGQLVALDTEGWKLEKLRRRARRNGISNVETRAIEAKTIKRLRASADRVLLDVPCSGLGVLRRNPDTKWKLQAEFLKEIQQVQFDILNNYSLMVKPQGKLVYATCSILPSESEAQVARFLKEQGENWALIEEERLSAHQHGFDGFYMACLQKQE
jgi:16S rRNA (cytosine967-C5)-methyltransferase